MSGLLHGTHFAPKKLDPFFSLGEKRRREDDKPPKGPMFDGRLMVLLLFFYYNFEENLFWG